MFASFLILAAAGAAAAATPANVDEPDPKAMSRSEIRAFNAKLEKGHPYYIRCERDADTGSLVKRNYSCRTNEQWEKAENAGNDNARDLMDRMSTKSTNGG
jgi:hypothetical protein